MPGSGDRRTLANVTVHGRTKGRGVVELGREWQDERILHEISRDTSLELTTTEHDFPTPRGARSFFAAQPKLACQSIQDHLDPSEMLIRRCG